MLNIQPFDSLGHANHGWLNARHHFSFARYWDPKRQGFGSLLVWNDDEIAPNSGFPAHPHKDMEIITYVREGAISHEDHLGNKGRTEAGDVQVMSAGTGIQHAEYNLGTQTAKIFQIWVLPDQPSGEPRWETKTFPSAQEHGVWTPLASGEERHKGRAAWIRASATLYAARINRGSELRFHPGAGRGVYAVPSRGAVSVNGVALSERSGLSAEGEAELVFAAPDQDAEVLLLEVPMGVAR